MKGKEIKHTEGSNRNGEEDLFKNSLRGNVNKRRKEVRTEHRERPLDEEIVNDESQVDDNDRDMIGRCNINPVKDKQIDTARDERNDEDRDIEAVNENEMEKNMEVLRTEQCSFHYDFHSNFNENCVNRFAVATYTS